MNDELQGTYALVHPDLTDDPVNKQGQIGLITYADPANNDYYVSFEKGQQGLYSADALLILQNHRDIHASAMANHREMETPDFKNLLQISRLLHSGRTSQMREALELARQNDTLRRYSLVSIEEKIGADISISEGFKRPPVISR
jgi:hypothetical protein